ncbi:MAG TPA: ATP-binding protein [Bryobacteraceae bacterium]|nr:ATP-binding protein [Bryobacteraceae bacterium]
MTVRSPVFRKLLLAMALLIAIALGTADFLLTRYTAERERSLAGQQLAQSLRLIVPEVTELAPPNLQHWADDTDTTARARVTLIDSNGVVLADSRHDPETMENHRERPEVRAALSRQTGSAVRRSATLDIDFLYYAAPVDLPGHPGAVLRLAVPLEQVGASIAAVRALILKTSGFAFLLALVFAYVIAQNVTGRIRRIEAYATELVNAEYAGTLAVEGDDELGSVARSLRVMAEHFRRMLAELAQESVRREAILSGMVEGVIAVDHNLRVTFFNEAFARAVHARPQSSEGASVLQVVRDPELRKLLAGVVETQTAARERMSPLQADGHVFEVLAAPLNEQGSIGAIATFHDVTELERLERVRKDFVANISHELRTPLAAIQGYAETLLDGALEDPENNRKFLEIIAAHTVRLTNLASDLLTLSEIEAERIPVQPERIAAVDLARGALQMVERHARERHVRAYLGESADVYISGQKSRLERALANLLLNGINYNYPGGEVTVDVRHVDGAVHIRVKDDGIGIAWTDIPRIFERFYRVDRARSRQTGGTGLGLSIVRNTVERAGGSVTVESVPGKGSVFTMIFPAA